MTEDLSELVSKHAEDVDPARVDAVWKRISRSRRHPAESMWTLPVRVAAVFVLALAVAGPVWALRHSDDAPLRLASGEDLPSVLRSEGTQREIRLSDGSVIRLGPESHLLVLFNELGRVEVLHRSGDVEFDVDDDSGRLWRIDAGLAAMEVMHATVRVERSREVRVSVKRGQALVRSVLLEDGVELLHASEALGLPTGVRLDAPMTHHAAPQTVGTDTPIHTSIPSRALLLRAERLRRTGQTSEAAGLLHSIVERNDAESPIAAFTLGRVHQAQRPELAAHDFALAIQLGLEEPLRRAAHRRWIESLAASGANTAQAEAVMLQEYPDEPLLQLDNEEDE